MKLQEILNKAINLHLSQNYKEAARIYKKIILLDPSNILALNNFGSLLNTVGDYDGAQFLLKKALSMKPDYLDALNNLGISLKLSKNYLEAIKIFEKIIKSKPNFIKAFINLGNCLQSQQKFEDALIVYDKVIKLEPDSVELLYNLGTCLNELNLQNKAKDCYNKILTIDPNFIEAKWNLAFIQLMQGNYIDGWLNHETRKIREKTRKNYKNKFENKNWLGQKKLNNKTIYIIREQGLGDFIQFCRYFPMLTNLGAKIILDIPDPLKKIIKTLKIDFTPVNEIKRIKYDYNCYLMSLPLAFKTKVHTIPNKTPYLFTPQNKKNYWKRKLGVKSKKRIGLMWSGNPENENDYNRSMKLENLINLLETPFEFHSLQIDYNKFDLKLMSKFKNLINHKDAIKGFDNTAGLIEAMDLIISVDTSVAHLSGALNKPIWLMLPFTPDFRWLLDRDDSPWYPSMKLYRQEKKGDWDTVVNKLIKDLFNVNF